MEFTKKIFNVQTLCVEELEKNFVAFKNDCWTLCMYHKDYSVDQMIGIVKMVREFIINDDNFRALNKRYDINCAKQLHELELKLQIESYKQLIGMVENGSAEIFKDLLESNKKRLKKLQGMSK